MPKKAEIHIQKRAPGPPAAIAPVTPIIFPGPTRMAVLRQNAANGEIPVWISLLCAIVRTPSPNFLSWMALSRAVKYRPEPTSTMMARENSPNRGICFQKVNILGKSQKKSDTGVTKDNTAFTAANKLSIVIIS